METLASYLTSCDILGVPKHRQFQTVTLFQDHDFMHLENIARFLAACSVLGVPVQHLFQTVALYENMSGPPFLANLTREQATSMNARMHKVLGDKPNPIPNPNSSPNPNPNPDPNPNPNPNPDPNHPPATDGSQRR